MDPKRADSQTAVAETDSSAVFWFLGLFAVVLRLRPYLANRSLWNDEAFVALNLLHRPLADLARPLSFHQAAPLGFLWLSKLAELAFGAGERALRLEPLLAALLAIALFFSLARRLLPRGAAIAACAVFALSPTLVYYASELKQYSGDVLAALFLWWAATSWREHPTKLSYVVLAAVGVAALVLSHPAALVAAAVGIGCAVEAARRRQRRALAGLAAVGVIWAVALLVLYDVSLARIARDPYFESFFLRGKGFVPWSPHEFVSWSVNALLSLFDRAAGIPLAGLALMCAALGVVVWRRDAFRLICWLGPIALAFLAAGAKVYPFVARTTLFAVPAVALLVGEGVEMVRQSVGGARRAPLLALVAVLFAQPVLIAARTLVRPRGRSELRPVLQQLRRQQRPGDAYYVYYGGQFQLRYYLETRGLPFGGPLGRASLAPITATDANPDWYTPALRSVPPDLFVGENHREDWAAYGRELQELRGRKRVWIIFAHVDDWGSVNELVLFLQDLDHLGRRLETIEQEGASAYLYDFSRSSA